MHKYTYAQIHIHTNTHTDKYTYAQGIRIQSPTHQRSICVYLALSKSPSVFFCKPRSSRTCPSTQQTSKHEKVTPAQCLPSVVQMMVSGAGRVVEIGGPQLGLLVRKELGGLLVGSSTRLGIQLGGWQWQRLLSIAAMAGT